MPKSIKTEDVLAEIKKADEAPYHRGKSWEHCYTFFRSYKKFRNGGNLLDYAALHLGFYLASWGMLRGSSFLLQKDYKYYTPIVRTLIKPKYDRLWNIDYLSLEAEKENNLLDLLFELKEDLRRVIKENNMPDRREHQTDLLITKIIMGTMGCTPAYDTYFKIGLKKLGIRNRSNFSRRSFNNLLRLIRNDERLRGFYAKSWYIGKIGIKYPPMKLIDLYFWLLGQ